ncbi:NADH dehydrogenase [ubiquinone] flavoprotein 3, mitochondrial [Engystomops pustulosus]|uniref:NADH dehydrogenase [ubiquinone] flavoprotein 3, mitochondrial n=1 Tax=Engystomops pustulosus TaxID=76066 RepID=UPI003AFAEAC2
MAAALRSVRRLQVLPRISVTCVRAQGGGKGSSNKGGSKTLVSFPVRVSQCQRPATGENRDEALRAVSALLRDDGGQSGTEVHTAQGVSQSNSSSSSSDSSSDSESEEEDSEPVSDRHADLADGGGHPGQSHKSSSIREIPVGQEQKDKMWLRGKNAEELKNYASAMTIAELPPKTPLGARQVETPSRMVHGRDSATSAANSKMSKTSDELPVGGIEIVAMKSTKTQIISTTRSEEASGGAEETSSPEAQIISTTRSEQASGGAEETSSPEAQIISTTRSEEASGGAEETSSPEAQIISTTRSEEASGGAEETSSPEAQIISTTRSEEASGGAEETSSPEAPIISTTRSEQASVGAEETSAPESAEIHESHSPPEPRAAPQDPFDNTKYQNLQHFNYTPFTFVEVDVELAKYRLPQPSSGRPSPRH